MKTAIDEMCDAVEFYDRIMECSREERVAVHNDHLNWIIKVARKIATAKEDETTVSGADDYAERFGVTPKPDKMPQTPEEWAHLAGLYDEAFAKALGENSTLRIKINVLNQRLETQSKTIGGYLDDEKLLNWFRKKYPGPYLDELEE